MREDAAPFDVTTLRPGADLVGAKDLPVYASAEGGPTGMTVTYDPIEYVKRPEPLMNVRGAFGFYVVGDSMWPRYRSGDLLLVHPTRPPQRHDHVLVMLHDGIDESAIQALVKVYVGWAGDNLQLEQYNPPGPVPSIPRAKVKGIHKIVGAYEGRS
jgi:phage repressor protein C with HTH and peptisase S24 domain